jgi:hypothetical protein
MVELQQLIWFLPIKKSAPTHIEVELGCDNFINLSEHLSKIKGEVEFVLTGE